jgi:hypothetical protein
VALHVSVCAPGSSAPAPQVLLARPALERLILEECRVDAVEMLSALAREVQRVGNKVRWTWRGES